MSARVLGATALTGPAAPGPTGPRIRPVVCVLADGTPCYAPVGEWWSSTTPW